MFDRHVVIMELQYGLHYDRDFLLDIVYKIKLVVPVFSMLTVYPASFYLLLVEGPAMISAIRTAYLAFFAVLLYFDVVYNVLMRVYALPPYGIFYCEGILCTVGLGKPIVMTLMSSAIIMGVPVYVFLVLRSRQMVLLDSTSRFNFSSKVQFVFMFALILVLLANVGGFVLYTKDVAGFDELIVAPELSWLAARGGTLFLFGVPGEKSEFVKEMIIFGVTFSIFIPPVIFLSSHAMRVLKQTSMRTKSTKTQRIIRNLFHVFRLQLQSGMVFFAVPWLLYIAVVIVDMRDILPGPLFAAGRSGTILLFTVYPTQFAFVFILWNKTHRAIIRKRLSRLIARFRGSQLDRAQTTQT